MTASSPRVEPDGVIVVRFAGDGSERKLMAEYAPVSQALRMRRAQRHSIRGVTATLIDGKAVAARVRAQVAEEVAAFAEQHGRPPGLATVLVGDDPASAVYVGGKQRASAEVGMLAVDKRLGADASAEQVEAEVAALNDDPAVSGILVQLPVPDHLDGRALTELVRPEKDVDGLTTHNAGMLALGTPAARRRARRSA